MSAVPMDRYRTVVGQCTSWGAGRDFEAAYGKIYEPLKKTGGKTDGKTDGDAMLAAMKA
jgi:hypothetical protein